ncbi:hypothetical protein DPMN_052923 [Dreissena polymorpha]|uniref:Uncharacterized protein n=1 Tax=Dreissena polymorpha TaxID=45954 RepID=A0A9D4HPQ6_DREPO|nr:hypothetical protein DPMN_052923 [Dreissena polymorpha]
MNDIEILKMLETCKGTNIVCDELQGDLIQSSANFIKRPNIKTVHNPSTNANGNHPTALPTGSTLTVKSV